MICCDNQKARILRDYNRHRVDLRLHVNGILHELRRAVNENFIHDFASFTALAKVQDTQPGRYRTSEDRVGSHGSHRRRDTHEASTFKALFRFDGCTRSLLVKFHLGCRVNLDGTGKYLRLIWRKLDQLKGIVA